MKYPAAASLADFLEGWDYMTMSTQFGKQARVIGENQELIIAALRHYAETAPFAERQSGNKEGLDDGA